MSKKKTKKAIEKQAPVTATVRSFNTMHDFQSAAEELFNKLALGETSVELGQAQLRALNSMTQTIALRLEHARLSGRIAQGDDFVPDLKVNPNRSQLNTKVIDMKSITAKKDAA